MGRTLRWFLAVTLAGVTGWGGEAREPLVAVVFGEHSQRESPEGEGRGAQAYTETVEAALQAAGVAYAELKDSEVEAGRLKAYKAAIFPYNFRLPEAELAAIEKFAAGGGKIVVFYVIHERLATLLGVRTTGHYVPERRNEFATIELHQDLIQGLPASVRQDSWNIYRVQPAGPGALVVGHWRDPDGLRTGLAALIVSSRGAYMGHVLTEGDVAGKGRMLLAVLGHLVPEVWQRASAEAIAAACRIGSLRNPEELAERVTRARVPAAQRERAEGVLAKARTRLAEAMELAAAKRYADALDAAAVARRQASEAFALSSPERMGELRGVWLPSPYGVKGWGWERTIRRLRDRGFNAVFVNLLRAGVAYYPSDVLPLAEQAREKGDPLAECLNCCKEYGIELHVWKVNYSLEGAADEVIEGLRDEGRLQRQRDGSELAWLCPSDPRNLELERDSMLEIVRKYNVHGVHFDYIRYPHERACFCDGCRERFEEALGAKVAKWPDDALAPPLKDRFAKWRQDQITGLVRAVATEARRIRPGVLVSAAVFSDWETDRYAVGQDWRLWLQEGLLDFACPMDYTTDAAALDKLVARQVEWVNGRAPLYVGIGAYRIHDTAGLIDQLERVRRLGADGFVCFHYDDAAFTDERLPALALSHTAHRTSPPHPAPPVKFTFPPGLALTPGLAYAGNTQVTVQVSLAAGGNFPKAVRSAWGTLVVETAEGQEVQSLGSVSSGDRRPAKATLRLPPGRYRLAVAGKVSFGWLDRRPFLVRSRPFDILGPQSGKP